jgi:hypothetical protein
MTFQALFLVVFVLFFIGIMADSHYMPKAFGLAAQGSSPRIAKLGQ